jgi:hypothetical protein
MQVVVELRYARDGLDWMEQHPRRYMVVEAMIEAADRFGRHPDSALVQRLIRLAEEWNRVRVWRLALKHPTGLQRLLAEEIIKCDLEHAEQRELLLRLAIGYASGDYLVAVKALPVQEMPSQRRAELIYDVMTTGRDHADEKISEETRATVAHALAHRYQPAETEVAMAMIRLLSRKSVNQATLGLSASGQALIAALLERARTDLAAVLTFMGTAVGVDCIEAARRVVEDGEVEPALNVLAAMTMREDTAARSLVRDALAHPRYKVRRFAMESLIATPDQADSEQILAMSEDKSADVRLAWARMMQKERWPASAEWLGRLLADNRNFDSRPAYLAGPNWADFAVARAAATALQTFEDVPPHALDQLLGAATDHASADPFVACRALTALTFHDDERVDRAVMSAFHAPPLSSAPAHRPLAQTAAWVLLDRAAIGLANIDQLDRDELLRVAASAKSVVAGPLIAAIGYLDSSLARSLAVLLEARSKHRLELLLVAAAASGIPAPARASGPVALLQATQRNIDLAFTAEQRAKLNVWRDTLDCNDGVQCLTAFLASTAFTAGLPECKRDIRQLEMPKRIGFITMRSLSPDAEESQSMG